MIKWFFFAALNTINAVVDAQVSIPAYQAYQFVPKLVTTAAATSIAANSATSGGTISASVGPVTARGVCWSTSISPTIALATKTSDGTGTGAFVSSITGLSNVTTYYVRAYATNADRTVYGPNVTFATFPVSDGLLSYFIYNATSTYANNVAQMDALISAATLTSSGTNSASVLLNWSTYNTLTAAGILIANVNHSAVVVTGFFVPVETGTYTFTTEGDDGLDLFINGVNVSNHYGAHAINGLGSHTGTIALVAGTKYTFRARMQENAGSEGLLVFWKRPSQSASPTWNLYPEEISSF